MGVHDGTGADGGAGPDGDKRTDRHVGANGGVARDGAEAIHPGRGRRGLDEQRHGAGERGIGIVGAENSAGRRPGAARHRAEDHRRRLRRRQLRQIAGVRDERQIARLRLLEAGDADDLDVAIPLKAARQPFGDLAKLQRLIF